MTKKNPDIENFEFVLTLKELRDIKAEAVNDALADHLHPEIGSEWQAPNGIIYNAVRTGQRAIIEAACVSLSRDLDSGPAPKDSAYVRVVLDIIKHLRNFEEEYLRNNV